MPAADGTERRSLDAALVKGIAWTGAASWVAQVVSWVSTLVVLRLLTPADYGLVALAGVYLGLATLLSEFGIGTAVVTLRDLTGRQLAELNTIALMLGTGAVGISFLASGPISRFFDSPRLAHLIWVMSSILVLASLGNISAARLQKELHFRYLATGQAVQALTTAATTLVIALAGGGYWALALGPPAGHAVMTAMVVLRKPTRYAWPAKGSLGPSLQFTRRVITDRAAWYGYTAADKLVIGRWIGEASVGLYAVASTFGMMAVEKITVLMLRVTPAVFSAVQADPVALRRYLLSLTEAVAIVTFPLSIGLSLTAENFVYLMLGAQWAGVIVPLQLLAIYGAFQSVAPLLNRVLAVVGDIRLNMRVSVLTLIVLPLAFIAVSPWGIAAVAAAWLLSPVLQIPLYLRLHHRIGLTARAYFKALWPALSAVAVMTVAILLLQRWPAFETLPRAANFALTIGVGAAAYCATILLVHSRRIRAFRDLMSEIRKWREVPAVEATG